MAKRGKKRSAEESSDGANEGFVDPPEQKRPKRKAAVEARKHFPGNERWKDQPQVKTGKKEKKKGVAAAAKSSKSESRPLLQWQTIYSHVPVQAEREMLDVLLPSKKKERGMMRSQPKKRLKKIAKCAKEAGMTLMQALSLRRHHIRKTNKCVPMAKLGMGKDKDIRKSAEIFETCVETYLKQHQIKYLTEKQQRAANTKPGVTPDFLLREPTLLATSMPNGAVNGQRESREHVIHWIEVKMFYGASTIPHDNKSAVGKILETAAKYAKAFDRGAMVFMYGCGDELALALEKLGVAVLDAYPIDIRPVEKHQRSWCANEHGRILP